MKIIARKLFFALAVTSLLAACSDDDDSSPPVISAGEAQPVVDSPLQNTGDTAPSVAQIESQLPPVSALDTFGGQLLAGYLQKTLSGEQVISQVFDEDDMVMSNLSEMSMAINQLKSEGQYSEANAEDVAVLEGAMTQFLNDRIATHKRLEDIIEYGTAAGLGVIGGVYSKEVLAGLRKLGNSSLVQAPKNAVISVYHGAKGQSQKLGAWLSSKSGKSNNKTVSTIGKSGDLYRRTVGYVASSGGKVSPRTLVHRQIVRIYGSDDLAKGVHIDVVPEEELASVRRMVFHKTGKSSLALHQNPGDNFFIARQLDAEGKPHYFYVRGAGVTAITKSGENVVVPPQTMTKMTAERLQGYGTRSVNFVTESGQKIKTGVTNSRAYQYVANSPGAQRALEGTAVGAAIGGITLLAIRPIDTRYLTLEDYVKDLEAEGVNIEEFLDLRRAEAQQAAR